METYIGSRLQDLSPEFQKDGKRTVDKEEEVFREAFFLGEYSFDWLCRPCPGEEPCPGEDRNLLIRLQFLKSSENNLYLANIEDKDQTRDDEKAHDYLRAIIEETEDIAVIKDLDLRIIQANRAFLRIAGKKNLHEIIGCTDEDIFNDHVDSRLLQRYMEDDRKAQKLDRGKFIINEEEVIYSDGSRHIYLTRKFPIYNSRDNLIATANISSDITEQKQTERDLEQIKKRYELAAKSGRVGVWDWNLIDNTIYLDQLLTEMLGYQPREIGPDFEKWKTMIHPQDRARVMREVHKNIEGKTGMYECEHRKLHRDGSIHWFLARGNSLRDPEGNAYRMIGTDLDITHQKEVEEELKEARKASEAANQAKSLFLANMSHELRTPLNAIIGYTQILEKDSQLDTPARGRLRVIERSGEHLLLLIDDLLDLSKIEAGKMELEPVETHLSNFLDDLYSMVRLRASEKGLELDFRYVEPLPMQIIVDQKRLRQILLNLLNNAIKYTDSGKVGLRVEKRTEKKRPVFRFSVADTGKGIPEDQKRHILKAFYQIRTHGEENEGTGLGLAITKRYLKMMNSRLHLDSTPGEGSVFWFDIRLPLTPRKKEDKQYQENGETEGEQQHKSDHRTRKIKDSNSMFPSPPPAEGLPDKKIIEKLYELSKVGDVFALEEEVKSLENTGAGYEEFSAPVRHALQDFEIDRIRNYLQSCLEQKNE